MDLTLATLLAVLNNLADRDLIVGVIVFGGLALVLMNIVRSGRNPIKLWHFIASRHGDDQWGDVSKLGQCVGIVLSAWVVVKLTYMIKEVTVTELVFALLSVLAFLGSVATFAAWFRSRQKRVSLLDDDKVTDKEP